MTFDDCRHQYVSTFLSNDSRRRKKPSRNHGLPDEFGEGIVRHHFPDFVSFKSATGKKGDMYSELRKILSEVKTATSSGPTSFAPLSNSTIYFFVDVDMETGKYDLYEILHELIGTAMLDSNTTLAQQWSINKALKKEGIKAPRPRFSMRSFVKKKGLKPSFSGFLIERSKLDLIREKHNIFWEDVEQII